MKKSAHKILSPGCRFGNKAFYIFCSILAFLFLLITFITSNNNAYGSEKNVPGKWWKNKKIVEKLELNNDQVNQIEGIFSSKKGKIRGLDSDLKKKERELNDAIKNPNSSKEDVLRLSNEVEEIRGSMRRVKVDMLLQIREVLKPEQRIKLQEIWSNRGKQFH